MSNAGDISTLPSRHNVSTRRLTVTVTTTATKIVPNDPNRIAILLINRGTAEVDFDFTQSVTFGAGLMLSPLGGNYLAEQYRNGSLPTKEIWGIVGGANMSVEVVEIVKLFTPGVDDKV